MRMQKKIGYSIGDFGISISYFVVGFFFMYYLTDIVGLAAWAAGTVIFIGRFWEGLANPLIGIVNDRVRSHLGAKRLFVLFGAIPFAVSFVLLWLIPASAGEWGKFTLATLSMLLYSTAYTLVVVPYMALVPAITDDYDERTQITGLRAILSTAGIVVGGGAALFISSFSDETFGLRVMAVTFGILAALSLLIAARSVKGSEKIVCNPPTRLNWGTYLGLFKQRNTVILLAFKFLGAIATGCLMASIPYFAKHILTDTESSTYGVAIYTISSALLIPAWYRLTHRFDKRRLLLVANTFGAIILFGVAFLVNSGDNPLFFLGCGLLGTVTSAYLLIPYSLVPDLVDFYKNATGEKCESVYFGLWMTTHQIGIAFSGLLLGFFLGILGYSGSLDVQTDSALLGVRLAFGLIPGVFLVLAALVLQKYGITRGIYQQLRRDAGHASEK